MFGRFRVERFRVQFRAWGFTVEGFRVSFRVWGV